ncbi:MAG: nucleotidyltransferase [Planctomycetes bacterium]|nr:nucleotidyltransferase [Planctomycetota bacterium]
MKTAKPTLVLLAAGVGSRYGGLKQLDAFGPAGETIMEYSIFDARRAGFGKVVFVIRPDMEDVFRDGIGRKIERLIEVRYAHQRLDNLPAPHRVPEGRTKPWGTGQALLVAADVVGEPFVAANADDLYGRSAYKVMGEFLTQAAQDSPPRFAMVGYRLRDTMSEQGTVSRGVCACDPPGWLKSIVETTKIEKAGDDGRAQDASGQSRAIPGDTLVSMNFWGFQPRFFDDLRAGFSRFLAGSGGSATAEYYLPVAVQESMRDRGSRVRVLESADAWCGVTHRHDKTPVESMLRRLVTQGVYPSPLWG